MKIAIVHPSLAMRGGAENVVIWLARELAKRGHQVTIFTSAYDDQFFGQREVHAFGLVTMDLGGYELNPRKFVQAGWQLRNVLEGYDWVNPHNFPAYHWAYFASRFNHGIGPIVWFCEEPVRRFYPEICNPHLLELERARPTPEPPRPQWRRRAAYLRANVLNWQWKVAKAMDQRIVPRLDLILTNSQFIANQVRAIFGVEARSCLLGIPPDRLPRQMSPSIARRRGRFLLTVSRLHPEKNLDTILQALKILRDHGSVLFDRYIIAGDGPWRPVLEHTASTLGISDLVEFIGFVSDAELDELYHHAQLVVYLPLDETFGLVFPEAGFHKKAVIGPNHGGPTEIIRDGVTGLQVNPMDPAEIAGGIERCLRDPDLLERFGEQGYRFATSELTIERFADRFEALLRQGLDDMRRVGRRSRAHENRS